MYFIKITELYLLYFVTQVWNETTVLKSLKCRFNKKRKHVKVKRGEPQQKQTLTQKQTVISRWQCCFLKIILWRSPENKTLFSWNNDIIDLRSRENKQSSTIVKLHFNRFAISQIKKSAFTYSFDMMTFDPSWSATQCDSRVCTCRPAVPLHHVTLVQNMALKSRQNYFKNKTKELTLRVVSVPVLK